MSKVRYMGANAPAGTSMIVHPATGDFDIRQALVTGSGSFVVDDVTNAELVSLLDKHPGVQRAGGDTPIVPPSAPVGGGPINARTATQLVQPKGGTQDNGVVVKAPDATWESDPGPYGSQQAIMVLRADDPAATTIPDDLVVFRVNGKGGVGIAGGAHFGTGLHSRSTTPVPPYSIHCNPAADTVGIYVDSAIVAPTQPYQQWRERDQTVVPNAISVVAEVNAGGIVVANRGVDVHSVNDATFAGVRIGRTAALEGMLAVQPTGTALQAGAVAGDVIIGSIPATRQVFIGSGVAGQTPAIRCGQNTVAFHGSAPQSKAAVTGSRGGNAALASLLTALNAKGLITDSSTV